VDGQVARRAERLEQAKILSLSTIWRTISTVFDGT
jgi:hypothetical protein